MDWLDLLAVQGTLKSLLQHHSSKASILQHLAFLILQLLHSYMTTGKTIALTRWTFVGKVTSLLFNMLSRLVVTFLPRTKHLLVSWLLYVYLYLILLKVSSLPPPSHPSRSPQSSELSPLSYRAASHQLCFTHGSVYTSMLLSLLVPSSPSPPVSP